MKCLLVILAAVAVANCSIQPVLKPAGRRIVGGSDADITEFPHQVSFQEGGAHRCGGSIISDKYVLTAAHCTDPFDVARLNIRSGTSVQYKDGEIHKVKAVYQHPWYTSCSMDWDISVVEIEGTFNFDDTTQPIELPARDYVVPTGVDAIVTGYGKLSRTGSLAARLQKVTVQTIAFDVCEAAYEVGPNRVTERMFCAGVPDGGQDACQGDSGGPVLVEGLLAGVVSWGYWCALARFPGVYTNVAALRDYITEITGL